MNFSPLFGSVTPTFSANTVEATNSCTQSCGTASITAIPTTASPSPSESKGLDETQIGAIIGGASAGVLVVALACCLIVRSRRKKNQPKFRRGRGITPSMVFTPSTASSATVGKSQETSDRRSTYSFNTPTTAFGSHNYTPSTPSEKTTAQLDELYNIKQYNVRPRPGNEDRVSRASQAGARLSKYNYLAQAFSQMRVSYAANEPKLVLPEAVHHHNSLHPQDMRYITTSSQSQTPLSPLSPSPSQQKKQTTITIPESATTETATHHHHMRLNASSREIELSSLDGDAQPPRITVFNEHDEQEEIIDPYRLHQHPVIRDSVTSDVSQYSTFSTSSNPYHPSADPLNRRTEDLKPSTNSNGRPYNYF
ncbi:hypothetical protein DFQ28_011689 [Apophysomyces sp. BC1034]|nr:hypothetical protein DFQ29_004320 [Apophysomyces sp. BC1021]KAG0191504.1 hypothetical protein DFQ28_011689 [Apophysomyces sp. BC1034]